MLLNPVIFVYFYLEYYVFTKVSDEPKFTLKHPSVQL